MGLPEGRRDPLLPFEVGTEAVPASRVTVRLEFAADPRDRRVSEDGEEPVAVGIGKSAPRWSSVRGRTRSPRRTDSPHRQVV